MNRVLFRFYAELNDFLADGRRGRSFEREFATAVSVKDAIEGLGVPHTEVDLVLVNGESVEFARQLRDGDRVSVYPVFESIDITPVLRLRPEPLREPRFVLDNHLGRLAAYLRMAGFDAVYRNDWQDAELAAASSRDRRILLTMDRGLLKRSEITHGYLVRETNPRRQLAEVIGRFDLAGAIQPFTRCLRCNVVLAPADRASVAGRVPPRLEAAELHQCPDCGRVYWQGSHWRRMRQILEHAVAAGRPSAATNEPAHPDQP